MAETAEKEQVYVIGKGMVDKATLEPVAKEEPKTDPKPDGNSPEAKAAQKADDDAAAAAAEAKAKAESETKKEGEEPKVKFTDEQLNEFLKSSLAEKYGIESKEDLLEVLENQDLLGKELEKVRAEKATKEPEFESETDKKAYEFIKQYPLSRHGEGLKAYAALMDLTVGNLDDRSALEEAFILKEKDLSRREAEKLFQREYREKYEVKKEDYDDDQQYQEEKDLREIKLKRDVANAKRELSSLQEKFKAPAEAKKEDPKQPLIPEETLKGYSTQIDRFFKGEKDGESFDSWIFKDDDGKDLFTIKLSPDKIKTIRETMNLYLGDPRVYDKSGKIPNFDPAELAMTMTNLLYGDWMDQEKLKQIKILSQVTKAEEIAKAKPDKTESGVDGGIDRKNMPVEDQFKLLAKEAAAERARKGIKQV